MLSIARPQTPGPALPRLALLVLMLVLAAAPAAASQYCGGNGVVKLAFADTDELPAVATVAPDQTGATVVDVWAVLDEVERLEGPGGVFLAIGGFELTLQISGAEGTILEKQIAMPYRDFGRSQAECRVGTHPGQPFEDGRLPLVRWRVAFQGEVADVVFGLAPDGAASYPTLVGADPNTPAPALYTGTVESRQEGFMFGAGYRPAVLNPSGEPDLEPVPCAVGWADAGVFGEPVTRDRR